MRHCLGSEDALDFLSKSEEALVLCMGAIC